MATIRFLLGVIWVLAIGSSWGVDRNIIGYGSTYNNNYRGFSYDDNSRKKLVSAAQKEVGVQEIAGNVGLRVDQYNAYVGVKKVPWCASFVSFCFGQVGYLQPRTAWSPALFPRDRLTKNPLAGMVMGIYFEDLKRVGHCGILERQQGDFWQIIEGNTNVKGSREGDGVWRKIRHKRAIHCFADWCKK